MHIFSGLRKSTEFDEEFMFYPDHCEDLIGFWQRELIVNSFVAVFKVETALFCGTEQQMQSHVTRDDNMRFPIFRKSEN
jgi:hypothetical protein